ncbi:MAG TPA: hypothetical protein VE359_06445 [Vicinamibacteria bacterium]|nr:hypothetical protein [Vicinamibacteria bacterium]
MRTKSVAILASALALGVLAVSAEAQQHKATRLGNPATRFAKPLKKADDLRVLLRSEKMKADVAAILSEAGWKGNHEDLDRAAASAEISAVQIAPGTRIPFMSSRTNKKPHALMDVLWAGKKPIDAFAFEFSSNCQRYRLVTPKACSNFWVEDLGKDTTDPKCNVAPPPPPVVSVSGASETCVTQPVEYSVTVKNPPADNNVKLYVNGKELVSDKLTNGAFKFTFTGAPTPGPYEVKAIAGGVTGTTTVQVKPCLPTCGITATPLPAKAGRPFTVDLSGSRVAAGVKGGVKSAKVEVVDPKGTVVDTFEMGAAGMTRSDVVIKRGGIHTLRAVVTDEAGQTSTNACTAQVDVKGGVPFYVGAYFGKERFVHDEVDGHDDGFVAPAAICAEHLGFGVGFQPMLGDHAQFDAQLGIKLNFEDNAHSALFADAAVNYVGGRGFLGGGLSWWDIGKDSGGIGPLVQGGFDLDKNGKWQLVGQARAPFSEFGDLSNNYQMWGGIRFRPNSWK